MSNVGSKLLGLAGVGIRVGGGQRNLLGSAHGGRDPLSSGQSYGRAHLSRSSLRSGVFHEIRSASAPVRTFIPNSWRSISGSAILQWLSRGRGELREPSR